jgi:hypothetical protein
VAVVGKGLTFDSGGYNLKAGAGSMIELMKFDMGGAAATLGAAAIIGATQPADVEVSPAATCCWLPAARLLRCRAAGPARPDGPDGQALGLLPAAALLPPRPPPPRSSAPSRCIAATLAALLRSRCCASSATLLPHPHPSPPARQVHFIIASCENMVSGKGLRPGDILTAASGKTIEVNNTDAEGRLTLADAMWYAQEKAGVSAMVDVATLTGACIIALGGEIAGLFTPSDKMGAALGAASKAAGGAHAAARRRRQRAACGRQRAGARPPPPPRP